MSLLIAGKDNVLVPNQQVSEQYISGNLGIDLLVSREKKLIDAINNPGQFREKRYQAITTAGKTASNFGYQKMEQLLKEGFPESVAKQLAIEAANN